MASADPSPVEAGQRPPPTPPESVALDQIFDADGLYALRAAVSAHGSELGLSADRVLDLVMIAHELATNVIRHGRTRGRLVLWRADGHVHCQVSDTGPGLADPASAGRERAPIQSPDGRGLWIVRQLSDGLDVDSSPTGARLTATLALVRDVPPP